MKSISGGRPNADPHMNGENVSSAEHDRNKPRARAFSLRGVLREHRGANTTQKITSQKGRYGAELNEQL
jgi:hypothetical protein